MAFLMPTATAAGLLPLGARPTRMTIGEVDLKLWQLGPRDGEPWILLHGMGSTALAWWAPLLPLRRDCHVLVPELSAHGGTASPGGGLGVAAGVELVLKLARRSFGERPVALGGISYGAWIAVRAALAAPRRVSRLILVAAAGYRDQDWERIGRMVNMETPADVDRYYEAMFVRTPLPLRLGRRAFLRIYTSAGVKHLLASTREADAFGGEELARLEPPVGLLWGEQDGLFRLPTARKMAAAIPRSHLEVVPGCGHGLQWERPRAFARAFGALRTSMNGSPATAPAGGRWTLRNT